MTTRIRLARGGSKKRPYYRIVVADQAAPRDGRYVERIGSYNPLLEENKASIDKDRAAYWLGVGARPTGRVVKIMNLHGIEVPTKLQDKKAVPAAKQKILDQKAAEARKAAEAAAKAKAEEEAKAKAEAEAAEKAAAAAAAEPPAEGDAAPPESGEEGA